MHPDIVADERARAMATIHCWLARDKAGCDAAAGTDEEAAVLLPVAIGELCSALELLTSPGQLRREVSDWLDEHRAGLAG